MINWVLILNVTPKVTWAGFSPYTEAKPSHLNFSQSLPRRFSLETISVIFPIGKLINYIKKIRDSTRCNDWILHEFKTNLSTQEVWHLSFL